MCSKSSREEWETVVASNLFSVFYASKAVLSAMRRSAGAGSSVSVRSAPNAHFGQGTISAYAAAKAAVVSFSRSLAIEEAKNGITVNVVNPSNVDDRGLTVRRSPQN